MKLIEAKQAKEFASTFLADKILQAAVNAVVDNAPEVVFVRCGECKKRPKDVEWGMCHVLCRQTHKDDYCSNGERRTDG
jgi:hypothetical protein